MVPTQEQIEKEIARLREMKPRVRRLTAFGDNNWYGIEAQIVVLDELLDDDDVYNNQLSQEDEDDGIDEDIEDRLWSQSTVDHALEAVAWLQGDNEELPSKDWEPLLVN